jgi:hypothetical protein
MLKVAVVAAEPAFPKTTVPGPLTVVQLTVRDEEGSPSSLAEPLSETRSVTRTFWSAPALTDGAEFVTPVPVCVTVNVFPPIFNVPVRVPWEFAATE